MRSVASMAVVLTLSISSAAAAAPQIGAAAGPSSASQPEANPSWANPPATSARSLEQSFYEASVQVSRVARHVVSFETQTDAHSASVSAYADAAQSAREALVTLGSRPGGRCALADIVSVKVAEGASPSVALAAGVLTVVITPARGASGVPSAGQIERVVQPAGVTCL